MKICFILFCYILLHKTDVIFKKLPIVIYNYIFTNIPLVIILP